MNEEICVCGKNAFSVKQYDDGKHQANCSKHWANCSQLQLMACERSSGI